MAAFEPKSNRYQLREACKISSPSRYRDSNEIFNAGTSSISRYRTPTKSFSNNQTHVVSRLEEKVNKTYKSRRSLGSFEDQNTVNESELQPSESEPCFQIIESLPAEISSTLQCSLRILKNFLILQKARRFVFCEFFYSSIDKEIFLSDNEFTLLINDFFPNLKCKKLCKPEWREIRRLIGRPRRCSQKFFYEERKALEAKRQKIRTIYDGTCIAIDDGILDLPTYLPRPPVRIYTRMMVPKDGIYVATIELVTDDKYRVVFENPNIFPCYVKDDEIMYTDPPEMVTVSSFIEMNRVNSARGLFPVNQFCHATTAFAGSGPSVLDKQKMISAKDEKVGNFPARMLVILVKLCKLVEFKKELINNLNGMNDSAENMNLSTNVYPAEFKIKCAQIVVDLETVNRLFKTYTSALHLYYMQLLPHLSEPRQSDQPDSLRKICYNHANQIVKYYNSELPNSVENSHVLTLISHLISLLKQLRSFGIDSQKREMSKFELSVLKESLRQIKPTISDDLRLLINKVADSPLDRRNY